MKTKFDMRLQNNLFPEPPESFSKKLAKALEKEGVRARTVHPWRIAATAIAATAAAASLLFVVLSAIHMDRKQSNPLTNAGTPTEQPVVQETEAPWNTPVFALARENADHNLPLTQEQAARAVLHFLQYCGENEPDELWILGMRSFLVPQKDGGELACVLILAQSDFGDDGRSDWGGTRLYCFDAEHGSILWGTDGVSNGPMQVAVEMEGQTWHFLYGANVPIDEPGNPYVKRGVVAGNEPGTDIEFSMFRPHAEMAELLSESRHRSCLQEYFLVRISESDWENGVKDRTLRFETLEGPYDAEIATQVPVASVITAEDAQRLHAASEAARTQTPAPYEGQVVKNLTMLSDEDSVRYTDAILSALRLFGVEPKELWLCAVEEPGLDPDEDVQKTEWRDESIDRKYLLAQYVFEGESGPELFYYYDNRVEWMTQGYEPYALNLVHDSYNGQTIVFGASCAFDGKPLPMSEGHIKTADADYSEWTFLSAVSLTQVQRRVEGSRRADAAREYYLVPMKGDRTVLSFSIEAYGKSYTPYEPNHLLPQIRVPYMAILADGDTIPGTFTHFVYATDYTQYGVLSADGIPVTDTLQDYLTSQTDPTVMPTLPLDANWSIYTVGEQVQVKGLRVYNEAPERVPDIREIGQLNDLPQGSYFVGFECLWIGSPIPGHNGNRNRMELVFYRVDVS